MSMFGLHNTLHTFGLHNTFHTFGLHNTLHTYRPRPGTPSHTRVAVFLPQRGCAHVPAWQGTGLGGRARPTPPPCLLCGCLQGLCRAHTSPSCDCRCREGCARRTLFPHFSPLSLQVRPILGHEKGAHEVVQVMPPDKVRVAGGALKSLAAVGLASG
eukprot:355608-Chlamydomonas_euryale.AAC.3